MDCDQARELVDAYAVGALTRRQGRQLEGHLARCPDCQSLEAEAAETVGRIALAAPLRRASPALRQRLLTRIHAPARERAGRGAGLWAAAAAVLLAVSLGALAWDIVLQNRVSDLQTDNSRLVAAVNEGDMAQVSFVATQEAILTHQQEMQTSLQEQSVALAVALDEQARPYYMMGAGPAAQASARYVWSAEHEVGLLYATGLPKLPSGMVYQFWLITEESPISGGTFAPAGDGEARLLVDRPSVAGPIVGMRVSLEPVGGSAVPSGTTILASQPSLPE